jgi:hypothetical protein
VKKNSSIQKNNTCPIVWTVNRKGDERKDGAFKGASIY